MKKWIIIVFAFILISTLIILISTKNPSKFIKADYYLMGTAVHIEIYGDQPREKLDTTHAYIKSLIPPINGYNPKSDISKINSSAGIKSIIISSETMELLNIAIDLYAKTNGFFDITSGPIIDLWKNAILSNQMPTKKEIHENLRLSGITSLYIDANKSSAKLTKIGSRINIDGIGKGFVLEKASTFLRQQKVSQALLSAGSTIVVIGRPDNSTHWKIGIRAPRSDKILGSILLGENQALSTSGDYEQFIKINGKRYCHIINPKNGMPADNCQSVTIVAKSGIIADALSTAVFAMGPWKGFHFIENMPDAEALIIKADGKKITTSGLKFESE